jgi:hypothetical protein
MKIIYMQHTIAYLNHKGIAISVEDKNVEWKDNYVVLTDRIVE